MNYEKHLYIGNHSQNLLDAYRNNKRKMIPEEVAIKIREVYNNNELSRATVGRMFGLSARTVSYIVGERKTLKSSE